MRIIIVIFSLIATTGLATTYARSDTRSWDQVTADFIAHPGHFAIDGERDGRRLKELDLKRAVAFLIPFLAKTQPDGLRVKAIGALGWSSFHEAIPALSAIALDVADKEAIRAQALNPGLRYMKHPEALKTATALIADASPSIRSGALWVLSGHGTDEAVDLLAARLRANDKPLLDKLMCALYFSKHPRAGKLVFTSVDFSTIPREERYLHAYALTLDGYPVPGAQQNMLIIAQQPGQPLSSYYALRYFRAFPCEDVVPALVACIEAKKSVNILYETVTEFIASPKISDESKAKLSAFIASGKVKKPEPPIFD
ncbi:MAG: HEAT repeat domain-containing protein [Chthoniobacter sp.]|nr:HEAT repeat domain-containing protein [Chthoniobacter sp.]